VEPIFTLGVTTVDKEILLQFQRFFNGTGRIYHQKNMITFRKGSKKDLKLLISHLDKYPLLTKKKGTFYCLEMLLILRIVLQNYLWIILIKLLI